MTRSSAAAAAHAVPASSSDRVAPPALGRARVIAVVLAVLAAFAMVFGPLAGVSATWAHDQLVSSTPAEGDSLAEAPAEAVLTYSGEVQEVGVVVELTGPQGESIELPAEPAVSGTDVTQQLPTLESGSYSLAWRVVSSDGHPIDGAIAFSVEAGAGADGAPVAGASEGSAGGESGGLVGGPATSMPADDGEAGQPTETADDGGIPVWVVIVIGLVGVVVVIGAIIGFMTASRRNDEMRERAEGVGGGAGAGASGAVAVDDADAGKPEGTDDGTGTDHGTGTDDGTNADGGDDAGNRDRP